MYTYMQNRFACKRARLEVYVTLTTIMNTYKKRCRFCCKSKVIITTHA